MKEIYRVCRLPEDYFDKLWDKLTFIAYKKMRDKEESLQNWSKSENIQQRREVPEVWVGWI